MPDVPGQMPVECGGCGAHFQLDPSGDIAGSACSECGGTRFFRNQPSPTQSDGTLRNMVDSITQKDQGGNPLGEGTIMGRDGERPDFKRDNYMHSKVAAPPNMLYEETHIPEGMSLQDYNKTRQKAKCPNCTLPFEALQGEGPLCPRCSLDQMNPELMSGSGTQQVMGRCLNTEPYAELWDESYLPKTAGPLAELAVPAIGWAAKNILPKALPFLMGKALGGAGGGGQQSGGMAPEAPDAPPTMEALGSTDIPFLLFADYDTPHSVKSIDEQHDDPEHQDQHEFNDGDHSPSNFENPGNQDSGNSGEDGVRNDTPGYGFGENSPGVERALMMLPLLLHHFATGEGHTDPLIRGLHDALEKENPGYLENQDPDGEKYVQMIIQQHKQPHGVQAGMNAYPSGLPEVPSTGAGVQAPGQAGGVCPACGGTLAGDGSCPQCGSKQHPQGGMAMPGVEGGGGASYPPNRTANGQGPVTPEQKESIKQAIDTMPWIFGDVLNEIQKQPNTPPLVDPSQAQPAPAPMQPMQGAPGGMPVNDPTQPGGGMPMQPMARVADAYTDRPDFLPKTQEDWHQYHPDDYMTQGKSVCPNCNQPQLSQLLGNCHHCGYRVGQDTPTVGLEEHDPRGPYSGDQMNVIPEYLDNMEPHWGKTADANNRVPRCPQCGSGTTTLMDGADGDGEQKGHCHACGATISLTEKKGRVILTDLINPTLQNAAEQHEQRPAEGEDSSLIWKDKQGQPMTVGQTYELITPGMDVPDEVQVVYKKPEELGLKLVGEFANIHGDPNTPDFTVTPQQMQSSGYEFVPSGQPDAHQEQPLGGMPGLDQIPQSPPTTDESASSYPNPGTVSHVLAASDDELEADEDLCHKCGGTWISHTASSPTQTMHECARCGTAWETVDQNEGREAGADLGWLYSDSQDDGFFDNMERASAMREFGTQSRSLAAAAAKDNRLTAIKDRLDSNKQSRTAGRHFTPGEQRELINERGTARNADLLDLSNTHYETRWDPTGKANGLNAPDEHLIMGL